jgi:hypothetical protein
MKPPQRFDTDEVRKVDEPGEPVPGGVTERAGEEDAGEMSRSGERRERRGCLLWDA